MLGGLYKDSACIETASLFETEFSGEMPSVLSHLFSKIRVLAVGVSFRIWSVRWKYNSVIQGRPEQIVL